MYLPIGRTQSTVIVFFCTIDYNNDEIDKRYCLIRSFYENSKCTLKCNDHYMHHGTYLQPADEKFSEHIS